MAGLTNNSSLIPLNLVLFTCEVKGAFQQITPENLENNNI